MRPLETLLSLANLLAFLVLAVPLPRVVPWMRHLAPIALAIGVAQVLVEGPRWQMVPAYALAGLFFVIWLLRYVTPAGKPAGHGRTNRFAVGLAVGLGILGLVFSIVLPMVLPVFRFPDPSGPYEIGTLTYHWVDADRPEVFTADPDDRRELMVQVWYPAKGDPSSPRAPYIQDADAVTSAFERVVDRIPVDTPTGLAFGFSSVWVTSDTFGTLSRIDPQTGEVVAKIDVDRGAVDVAVDENSGAVLVTGQSWSGHNPEQNKLTRVDPATNRVVAKIPIRADQRAGGADNVAVGEGTVWVSSPGSFLKEDPETSKQLLKVDPETNEVAAMVSVGPYYDTAALVVYGGGVWVIVNNPSAWLVRVDPRTMHVVAYKTLKPFNIVAEAPGLAAGGGYVWFSSGKGLARVAP